MSVESSPLANGIMDVAVDFVNMLGEEGDGTAAQPAADTENYGMPDAVAENSEIARKIAGWSPGKARVKLPEVAFQNFFNEKETKRKVLASGKVADAFDADNFRYTQLYVEFAEAVYKGHDASCEATVMGDLAVVKLPLDDPIPGILESKVGVNANILEGDWTVVWLDGNTADITVTQGCWSLFDTEYQVDLSNRRKIKFSWSDGTVQTLQRSEGNTLHWTTTNDDYPTMKWVNKSSSPLEEHPPMGELELLEKELLHSEVLMSNMILHKPTDTEIWFCCYKRNLDHKPAHKALVKSHISDDEPLRMVIVARGTDGLDDVATDLQFNLVNPGLAERYASFEKCKDLPLDKVKVHSGFAEQVVGISNEIDAEILQMMTKYYHEHSDLTFDQLLEKHPMMFTFVGHSMGGALARLFCFDYLCRNAAKGQGWTRLVTIGSAPTGNAEFASSLDKLLSTEDDPMRCLHVVNNKDPIPVSLDRWWVKYVTGKYEHCGTLVWINEQGDVLTNGKPTFKLCQCPWNLVAAGMDHKGSAYRKAAKNARETRGKLEY